MWLPSLGLPLSFLGLAAQVPLQPSSTPSDSVAMSFEQPDFQFKDGPNVFTPKNMIELARPGSGIANPAHDLLLISSSKYSFEDKK